MRLRTRITVGYGYLVALLVISVATAALSFQQLGRSIGRVMEENFRSVAASMQMLQAIERQDSAVLGLLLGDDASQDHLLNSETLFLEALDRAANNITIDAERSAIDSIRVGFERYRMSRDRLLEEHHEHPLQDYKQDTFLLFEAVKERVVDLLDLNHRAMIDADRAAQRSAAHRAVLLGFMVTLAVVSLGFLSRGLNRDLLSRLAYLQAFAVAITQGERKQRAPIVQQDELGALAHALNSVLDRQEELEGRARARRVTHRQLLLGLLHAYPQGALVVTLSGDLVAGTLDEKEATRVMEAVRALDASTVERRQAAPLFPDDPESGFTAEPLWVDDVRPVGWLVRRAPADPGA